MRRKQTLTTAPDKSETIAGWFWLIFQLTVLPSLLTAGSELLNAPLNPTQLNFAFFLINFLAVLWIFRSYLGASAAMVLRHPAWFAQAVILGFVAYFACAQGIQLLLRYVAPGFQNANDQVILSLSRGNYRLMVLGTVLLVPVAEECFYRGLLFRKLYGKSRVGAYLVSMTVFSLIHIVTHLQSRPLWEIGISFLQYLPAGLCLAWSYAKADTIFAPIAIHALINAVGISRLR